MPRNVTHDHLCPKVVSVYNRCECDLIARVRADEREQAAARVQEIPGWEWSVNPRAAVLSVIYRGGVE